jgi:spermidine synthase
MTSEKSLQNSVSKIAALVLVCFFLSGLTGLVYEILWTRMIVKVIGGAPFAVSIVLTVFMGGLGLGSFVASRIVDRIKEPLKLVRIYGILELAIGGYCLVLPVLLVVFRPLYAVVYNQLFRHFVLYNLLTFVGCLVLLCAPVICMGATLPILCRFYVRRLSHLGAHAGSLYGLNTIGAALGALLCGFWLIDVLGMWGSLFLAVAVNVLIGSVCVVAGYRGRIEPIGDTEPKEEVPGESDDREFREPAYKAAASGALVIFAVSGFCAMAYEVIWTRLLGLLIGPTTYSFTIVLVTFILGLALGSMVFGWLADRTKKPLFLLVTTQVGAALFALVASQILGNGQLFFAKLIFNYKDDFAMLSILNAVVLFAFMFLPTLCLGATFPLVGKIYTRSVSKVGRSIGFAYMVNAAGAVLGSFCAGFILVPVFGKENSLSMLVCLQLLASLVLAAVVLGRSRMRVLKVASLAAVAIGGLLLCLRFPGWDRHLLSRGRYHRFHEIGVDLERYGWVEALFRGPAILAKLKSGKLVYYGDGIGGFTTVLEHTDGLGNTEYIMANSGKPDASSRGDMNTQTLSAHLGMLFHAGPRVVMVLGLASGVTAGEALYYPIEQVDVVDINQQVVKGSEFFRPWNNDVLYNPRTNLIIQDGRAHLELTKQKYDVIISEPSNPWMAGLAALFTRDFFELVEKRLNDDGIFVQWLYSYQMDWSTFALIGRTFAQVFPHSILVRTSPSGAGKDYLLAGFKGDAGLILENAESNLAYIQQSKNVTLLDGRLIYKLIVSEDLEQLFGPGPVHTDSWPRLEFAAPRLMHERDPMIAEKLQSEKWLSPETSRIVQEVTTDIEAQIGFARYAFSLYEPFPDMVDLSRATPAQRERFFSLMEAYCASNKLKSAVLKDNEELGRRCRAIQIETIQNKIELMPDKAASYFYLANLYFDEGMVNEAIVNYRKSLEIDAYNVKAHFNLGGLLIRTGELEEAIRHLNEAVRLGPDSAGAHYNLGMALSRAGEPEGAIKHYLESLRIAPKDADAHYNVGGLFLRQGKLDDAIRHYTEAVRIDPDSADSHNNLGYALAFRGRLDEAVEHYTEALRLNPNLANAHNNIGLVFVRQGKLDEAVKHFREALRIQPDFADAARNLKYLLEQLGESDESPGP